ncbi:hypothetical protein DESC_720433 [Desulfosarcina cetonica]|nr:hypothetical protein DESC_720433 [Desulfosarcina cetonica]
MQKQKDFKSVNKLITWKTMKFEGYFLTTKNVRRSIQETVSFSFSMTIGGQIPPNASRVSVTVLVF